MTISATLNDTDQAAVATAVGFTQSSLAAAETASGLLTAYLVTISEYISDQGALDTLTEKVGAVATTLATHHATLNTLAIKGENAFNLTRGTWGGHNGTYHSASGGTDKA